MGSLVSVPFHGRPTRGWVLGPTDDVPSRMLRVRKAVSDVRFFDERLLALMRWVSTRYVAPLATVITRSHPPRVASEETAAATREPQAIPAGRADGLIESYRNGAALGAALREGAGTFVLRPVPEEEQGVAAEAVQRCVDGGRTALVLVPEAEPLPATAGAVRDALGAAAAVFVGGDKRQRYRMWLDVLEGGYRCVIGTRPAVFAPLRDLGLVWISRDAHPGHREERSPYYHVRDVALARARLEEAVCVTAGLCPSGEAVSSPGGVHVSPSRRSWVPVEVVRPGPSGRAPRLLAALKGSRRSFVYEPLPGFGIARVCRSCGEAAACAACGGLIRSVEGALICTVCEAAGRCAACGSGDFGVVGGGAERVEEWLRREVSVPVRRGAGPPPPDRAGASVGGPEDVRDTGPLDLDVVAILDADRAPRRPGLSAMERSVAVWMEAAGWARPRGRVVVQARSPGDPAVQALVAGNPERFHRFDRNRRAQAGFPVGSAVFRVAGDGELPDRLSALRPITLLETAVAGGTVCLVALRPQDVQAFGELARSLAARGGVTRVEAEPHL